MSEGAIWGWNSNRDFALKKLLPTHPTPKAVAVVIGRLCCRYCCLLGLIGSILYGLRLRLSVFGLLGSGEGSAGRAVHASHVPRKPTLPACAVATLAVAPLSPSTCRLFACALQDSTLPEPLPPAICYAIDTAATNGNHRQQSTTRRHCLCYRLIDTAAVALRRRSAPLRSAVCSLRSPRVGRALVAILSLCLGFGVLSP